MLNKEYRIHRYIPIPIITIVLVVLSASMTFQLSLAPRFPELFVLIGKLSLLEILWVTIAPSFFMAENRRRRIINCAGIAGLAFIHGCLFQRCMYTSWCSETFMSWGSPDMLQPVEHYWYLFGIFMAIEALLFCFLAHLANLSKKHPYRCAVWSSLYSPMYWAYLWAPAFWLTAMQNLSYNSFRLMQASGIYNYRELGDLIRANAPGIKTWIDLYMKEGHPLWEMYGLQAPGLSGMLTYQIIFIPAFLAYAIMIPLAVQLDGLRMPDDKPLSFNYLKIKRAALTGFDPGDDLIHAKRLVLCVTPPDILDQAHLSFQWTRLIRRYGGRGRDSTGVLGFLIGEDYVLCPQAYRQLTADQIAGKEKICMLVRRDAYLGKNLEMITDYSRCQYRLMDEYITGKEAEGFQIFLWEKTYGANALYKNHILKTFMESPYPVRISSEEIFPLSGLDQLASIRSRRRRCREMYEAVKAAGKPYLEKQFLPILAGEDTAASFYDLMKIAEYCIHIRALSVLSDPGGNHTDPAGKSIDRHALTHLSLGTMQYLQRSKGAPEAAVDITLVKALKDLRQDKVKLRIAGFDLCTDTIVFLRNKYVGHGTMIYQVSEPMLESLAVITERILTHFLAGSHELGKDQYILPEVFQEQIPAVKMIDGQPWYFSRLCTIKGRDCIDYMAFDSGRHRFYDLPGHPVRDNFILDRDKAQDMLPLNVAKSDLPPLPRRKVYEKMGAPLLTIRAGEDSDGTVSSLLDEFPQKMVILGGAYTDFKELFGRIREDRRYDSETLHQLGIKVHVPVSITFIGGKTWDLLIEEGVADNPDLGTPDDPVFMEDMAMLKLVTIYRGMGNFLPWADIHVIVFGESRYKHLVKNPYPWIRVTDVQYFENGKDALLYGLNTSKSSSSGLIQTFRRQGIPTAIAGTVYDAVHLAADLTGISRRLVRTDYNSRQETYLRIINELGLKSPLLYAHNNIYNAGFIKNILEFQDITTAVIALFDYMEFTCLTMSNFAILVHLGKGKDTSEDAGGHPLIADNEHLLIQANFTRNCQNILYYMPENAPCYEDLHFRSIKLPPRLKQLHRQLADILCCDIVSDQITFINLAALVGALRNITKGHGYIRGMEAGVLWEILMYDAMMLNRFLHLNEFHIEAYDSVGQVILGYPDAMYHLGSGMTMDHRVPCPLYSVDRRGRLVYMNYFEGKFTVPQDKKE